MAKHIKAQEYERKRNAILDVAQRCIVSSGYEQMSIQDILVELKISKGAFYHYFGSKQELLEVLVERMLSEAEGLLRPLMQDAQLTALEKLQRFFASLINWKSTQQGVVRALLRAWYADENALVRQKVRTSTLQRLAPLLTIAIRQGQQEGIVSTDYPDEVGEVALSLGMDLGDALGRMLLASEGSVDNMQRFGHTLAMYVNAMERVLGVRAGSLQVISMDAKDLGASLAYEQA